jgi:hypothetical protein
LDFTKSVFELLEGGGKRVIDDFRYILSGMQLFSFLFKELIYWIKHLHFGRELLFNPRTAEYIFKVNPVLLTVQPIIYCLLC